jgi:hypothetical protein
MTPVKKAREHTTTFIQGLVGTPVSSESEEEIQKKPCCSKRTHYIVVGYGSYTSLPEDDPEYDKYGGQALPRLLSEGWEVVCEMTVPAKGTKKAYVSYTLEKPK